MLPGFRLSVSLTTIAAVLFLVTAGSGQAVLSGRMRSSSCVPSWRLVSTNSPNQSWFSSVVVVSRNDVWVVGAQANGAKPLIFHWNGKEWRTVAPALQSTGQLNAVAALGPKDVWAFGDKLFKKSERDWNNVYRPIAEHWNGRAWQSVAMPAQNWRLWSAVAVLPRSVWVAGSERILRWDGKGWRIARAAGANAIAARSDDDVWVAGGPSHWNGSSGQYEASGVIRHTGFRAELVRHRRLAVESVGSRRPMVPRRREPHRGRDLPLKRDGVVVGLPPGQHERLCRRCDRGQQRLGACRLARRHEHLSIRPLASTPLGTAQAGKSSLGRKPSLPPTSTISPQYRQPICGR